MEHYNPLLKNIDSPKFFTIGEIMLRLTPPNYEKIRMTNNFEASYGGSEANIALAKNRPLDFRRAIFRRITFSVFEIIFAPLRRLDDHLARAFDINRRSARIFY